MEAPIAVHLLGPVQIFVNGAPIQGFESRKALALLCYLAEQKQPISRQQLVHLFWGTKSDVRGRANLSRVLHNNSALLPGCFEATRDHIQFVQSHTHEVDVNTFAQLLSHQELPPLLEAVNLYRGDLMADLTLPDCPEFEVWLVAEQEMWRRRMVEALQFIVTSYMNASNYETGLHFAKRLLTLDPWQEETYRQMMLMLALSGQRIAALAQYENCRRVLTDELGITPAADTITLYERIRGGEIGHRRHLAPATSNRFANIGWSSRNEWNDASGLDEPSVSYRPSEQLYETALLHRAVSVHGTARSIPRQKRTSQEHEQDLAQISERLFNPACRLLTLVGCDQQEMKALVLELMTRESHRFQHGVCFVTASNGSVTALVISLLLKFNLALDEIEQQIFEIYKYVRDKEMLLIIYNIHFQSEGVALLEDILKRAPMLRILATSTKALDLSLEWIYDVD